jgi:hypothetical protein
VTLVNIPELLRIQYNPEKRTYLLITVHLGLRVIPEFVLLAQKIYSGPSALSTKYLGPMILRAGSPPHQILRKALYLRYFCGLFNLAVYMLTASSFPAFYYYGGEWLGYSTHLEDFTVDIKWGLFVMRYLVFVIIGFALNTYSLDKVYGFNTRGILKDSVIVIPDMT